MAKKRFPNPHNSLMYKDEIDTLAHPLNHFSNLIMLAGPCEILWLPVIYVANYDEQ